VLYFPRHFSDSFKLSMQRRLTEEYIDDWNEQMKKATRQAEIQALRGEAITARRILLKKDYYHEQIKIQLNQADVDIFS